MACAKKSPATPPTQNWLAIRHAGWTDSAQQLRELYRRMVLDIAISNIDDHLRNHAAFWDGTSLRLTPAHDLVVSTIENNWDEVCDHVEGQKRNVVWQATEVLESLDRFGERARRSPRTG